LNHSSSTLDFIKVTLGLSIHVGFGVCAGLLNIPGDVEGISGSLRNSETVVECDTTWNGTKSNNYALHLVYGKLAVTGASGCLSSGLEGPFETSSNNQRNDSSCELANTLHGKHGVHHGTSPFGSSKLRCDNGTERVVTTDSNTLIIVLATFIQQVHELLTIIARQNMMKPVVDIARDGEERA